VQGKPRQPAGIIKVVKETLTDASATRILDNCSSARDIAAHFRACPALRLLRANLLLASTLPAAQRPILFQGMAINPRMLQFASTGDSEAVISKAQADLEAVIALLPELKLSHIAPFLEEQVLWLQLEQTATEATAQAKIAEEIKDPAKTMRRVRLDSTDQMHVDFSGPPLPTRAAESRRRSSTF
jgi:hypothetical protein